MQRTQWVRMLVRYLRISIRHAAKNGFQDRVAMGMITNSHHTYSTPLFRLRIRLMSIKIWQGAGEEYWRYILASCYLMCFLILKSLQWTFVIMLHKVRASCYGKMSSQDLFLNDNVWHTFPWQCRGTRCIRCISSCHDIV